ncbi:DUF3858 domain-containing protein [Marivirga sp.]|uniref:DUF3858 domain-containing protein n=1 Tax=Marivirga sp. TaxID=2018662 RepID=UPI003DA75DC8
MKYIFFPVICLFSFHIYSQQNPKSFGNVSSSEIEMQFYQEDPSAPAVVLFDVGDSEFFESDYGYDIIYRRHKRIKIFDKNKFGTPEISVPIYRSDKGEREQIVFIEAQTLNMENGKLKKSYVLPGSIFEEKINDNWSIKKFVFPNVQNGSIVEFRYEIETPFKSSMPNWDFQSEIPTIYSRYMVSMIPFYEYVFYLQGASEFDEFEKFNSKTSRSWGKVNKSYGQNVRSGFDFQDVTYKFVLKDIPAFKDESYISSVNNHIVKMYFQLAKIHHPNTGKKEIISTWSALNKSLLKNKKFGKYIKKSSRKAKGIVKDLEIEGLSKEAQSKVIINYIKDNFEWNGRNSKYASQTVKELLKSRLGNSADLNLFLIGMLHSAKIDCEPVILSTREHGAIRGEYPFDFYTNYVVGLVGEESSFLADATSDFLPYNRIPSRCLNDKALIVKDIEKEMWISLDFEIPSINKSIINLIPNPDDVSLDYSVTLQANEYEAYALREKFEDEDEDIQTYFKEKLDNIDESKTLFYNDLNKPYILILKGEKNITKIGSNLIIRPLLELPIQENKLTQSVRNYPVDFVFRTKTEYETNLEIPNGYRVSSVPDNFSLNNDLIDINLSIKKTENRVSITGNYEFKKSIYQPEEYTDIKQYFDIIIEKFNQEIVLEEE